MRVVASAGIRPLDRFLHLDFALSLKSERRDSVHFCCRICDFRSRVRRSTMCRGTGIGNGGGTGVVVLLWTLAVGVFVEVSCSWKRERRGGIPARGGWIACLPSVRVCRIVEAWQSMLLLYSRTLA